MVALSTERGRYVYLETFGCQMNENDTGRMMGLLKDMAFKTTERPDAADLIIINTCSVRDKAEHKLYSILGRFKELKEERPGLIIAVAGCVAQQLGAALFKRAPYIDLVIGTQNVHRLKEILERPLPLRRVAVTEFRGSIDANEYAHNDATDGGKAFVAIMRGCDNFCTYCIVPYTRGAEASRKSSDILREVSALVNDGVKEVTLVGQNVNSYGRGSGADVSFPELLRMTAATDGIRRVRFMTSHPKDISGELIDVFQQTPVLCRHLHLPVQSGSDSILKMMRRGYTAAQYLEKTRRIRQRYPDISLTSDIIVGFPGETDADFEATMLLINEARFDNVFAFIYSPRPGTEAAGYAGQVPAEIKAFRLQTILETQREITLAGNRALEGSIQEVMVEDRGARPGAERKISGRTSCGRIVHFHCEEGLSTGSEVRVIITAAHQNSLRGEFIAHAAQGQATVA
ncbi:MAG: tRNA (N6-isopentenyl adenosine(37)-C2)-methylthiotransferase MiaB [Deltaproteobacteria bacterium]|nr:tRNA (N6-isopentenyl adenosine(37)-C2)-methylthiotransferase MiaB [Deltaproteobacteria bacterium]